MEMRIREDEELADYLLRLLNECPTGQFELQAAREYTAHKARGLHVGKLLAGAVNTLNLAMRELMERRGKALCCMLLIGVPPGKIAAELLEWFPAGASVSADFLAESQGSRSDTERSLKEYASRTAKGR